MDLTRISKIHFIGIGGIGISALAKMMKLLGKQVSGSDAMMNETTRELEKMDIKVFQGHYFKQVPDDIDLVVYSSAVPEDNLERQRAKELGVPELSYFEFLGEVSADKFCIAVAGTHGKSTTAAMLGKILIDAGLDPTVIVGSKLKYFEHGNFRLGQSKYLVVEACEHQANFLHLNPNALIITNIEAEHLDFYKDLEDVALAFQRLVDKLPADGLLIYNADDEVSKNQLRPEIETLSFALKNDASFEARGIKVAPGSQKFEVFKNGESFSAMELEIAGAYNVYNALGAIALADHLRVSPEKIKNSLKQFSNLWRRMETVGKFNGALVISDYGHHPTEIAAAISAARDFHPNKRLVWVFQPHQHARTKRFFKEFSKSFGGVDLLLVSDIFDVAGREMAQDQDVSSGTLVKAIKEVSPNIQVQYSGGLEKTQDKLQEIIEPDDVVVIQGAGDIDEIARELASL